MTRQQKLQHKFSYLVSISPSSPLGCGMNTRKEMFLVRRSLKCTQVSMLLLIGSLFLPCFTMAFEVKTHRQLTEKAIESNESQLNTYLVDNLGLEGGLNEQLGDYTARGWMIEGSDFEDEDGFTRPINHFHDPITDEGLTVFTAVSAIDWSLSPMGAQSPGGPWSWNDAREYYFKALTLSTKAERDEQWGNLFRALGQIMHLLQDQASPAHVRNDPHLAFLGIGDPDGLHDFMAVREVATYVGLGIIGPDPTLLEQAHQTQPVPVANLFDYNQYTGSNPEASLGGQAGMAEYANANFFSDDRIPGQIGTGSLFFRSYSHPSLAELVPAPVPSPYLTLPRLGSAAFPSARTAKLTGNQAVAKFLLTNTNLDLLGQLQLDDAVYDAQAQNLIPRAVGYSAAVLDYFFRGELDVSLQEFQVLGTVVSPTECSPVPDPVVDDAVLQVELIVPSDLDFVGTASLYYDRSDEIRVLAEQRLNPPSGQKLFMDGLIPFSELLMDDPVRWYVVLEGQAGPGAQEDRAILATTDLADWQYACIF